jgi:protease-4
LRQTPPVFTPPPHASARRARTGTGWKVLAIVALTLFVLSLVFNPFHAMFSMMQGEGAMAHRNTVGPRLQEAWLKDNDSGNKIAVIPIEGVITSQGLGRSGFSMVDLVEDQLRRAAQDKNVKAVILKVNSPGGEVLASDDIYNLVEKFQNKSGKPVVAAMGSLAASGGYYVSAPCQWIVANEMTITGSIGVIMHGYNVRGLMDKVGIRPEVFKSGKFKDMLSWDKREQDITQEERDLIQSMVNETFDKFKSVVAAGRENAARLNGGSTDKGRGLAENWQQFADGRILSGKEALKYGFVDEVGNFDVAVARAQKLAKIPDANLIQYQQIFDLGDIFGILGQGEARTLKVDVGLDTPKLQIGRLYFICPTVLPR